MSDVEIDLEFQRAFAECGKQKPRSLQDKRFQQAFLEQALQHKRIQKELQAKQDEFKAAFDKAVEDSNNPYTGVMVDKATGEVSDVTFNQQTLKENRLHRKFRATQDYCKEHNLMAYHVELYLDDNHKLEKTQALKGFFENLETQIGSFKHIWVSSISKRLYFRQGDKKEIRFHWHVLIVCNVKFSSKKLTPIWGRGFVKVSKIGPKQSWKQCQHVFKTNMFEFYGKLPYVRRMGSSNWGYLTYPKWAKEKVQEVIATGVAVTARRVRSAYQVLEKGTRAIIAEFFSPYTYIPRKRLEASSS